MSVCTRKDGTIFVNWMEAGKRKRKYFGHGTTAMAEAVRFSDAITQQTPVRQQCGPVFAQLVNEYTTAKACSMSDVSMSNLLYKMEAVILPALGDLPAVRIDHALLDKYVAMRAASVKNTTIHRELSDIRAILRWSVKRGLIPTNPMADFEMPRRDDAIILPLSHDEIEAILAHSPEHLKRAMLLSFFVGCGRGRWSCCRFDTARSTGRRDDHGDQRPEGGH